MLRFAALAALSLGVWAACTALFFSGHTDDYYVKCSSPRQRSLILGTSRAAQGLVPAEIDPRALGARGPLYNFAFASSMSRYGRAYLQAVERKLADADPAAPGLFLLEVSPLAISTNTGATGPLPEDGSVIGKLHSFTLDPNVEYPFYAPNRGYDIIDRTVRRFTGRERLFVHADGWVDVRPIEAERREASITQKLSDYAGAYAASELSPMRLSYLERTVALLAPRGQVVLVLLPLEPRLRSLERRYMPEFDDRMRALAEQRKARYIDLSDLDAHVSTNDGNHLRRDDARRVSRELAARLASPPR